MTPPTDEHPSGTLRLGDFDFDPQSGELFHRGEGGKREGPPRRLGPQPAHLLRLLITKDGGLLTREEIREALWPDVAVDFDQALHFAVRQVRAALDDSAAEPRYIETLPRRGYRLRVPVVTKPGSPVGPAPPGAPSVRHARPPWLTAPVLGVAVVAAIVALVLAATAGRKSAAPIRLGVMPLEEESNPNGVAERLLLELDALELPEGMRLEVVGPTSTERFRGRERPLRTAARELALDYLVNGRFLRRSVFYGEGDPPPGLDDEPQLFVEVIRVSDGAHIWVEGFDRPTDASAEAALARVLARATVEQVAGSP